MPLFTKIAVFRCASISWFQVVSNWVIHLFQISSDSSKSSDFSDSSKSSDSSDSSKSSDSSDSSKSSDSSDSNKSSNSSESSESGESSESSKSSASVGRLSSYLKRALN